MTVEELKSKMQYGDYNTLARMLGVQNAAAARARFLRGDEEAYEATRQIIQAREDLIKKFRENE